MIQDHAFTFGWTLLHFLWQGTALALLVWITLGLARRARPELRYALACAGLVLMALAPIVTYGVLRQTEPAALAVATEGVRVSPAGQDGVRTAAPGPTAQGTGVSPRPSLRAGLDLLAPWLVPLWGLGVLVLAVRMVGGATWLSRARRRSRPEEGLWSGRLDILRRQMGLARRVTLRVLEDLDGPVVVGALRPLILIPASLLTGLPAAQVELLLAHELAHVARHDYAANLLQRLVETLLFFHPAVGWLGRRVRQERERCCDAVAADLLGDPCGMAEALTSLEDLRLVGPWPAFALGATGGFLGERVRVLLNLEEHPNRLRLALAGGLLVLCGLSGLGLWHLRTHRLARQSGPASPATWSLGNVQLRRYDAVLQVEFEVKEATAAEVLETFDRAIARQADTGSTQVREAIQRLTAPAEGQPSPERYTVRWNLSSRAQFMEYWHRLKARPALDCPPDTIVVRRDNLALPWDRPEAPPLDLWVPRHADEFNIDAARLTREAILELQVKAPTPGLPQEARRKVPATILATLKSPEPGVPLLRCGDSDRLEVFAKRAQEEPFTPVHALQYTFNAVTILDLPAPGSAERNLVQTRREALAKHAALDQGKNLRNGRKGTAQEKKDFLTWKDQDTRLKIELALAEEALQTTLTEKGFQGALQQVRQRLSKLPAETAKSAPRNPRVRMAMNQDAGQPQAWFKAWDLRVDPGLLRQSPASEAELLRGLEAALQARLERIRAGRGSRPAPRTGPKVTSG
jgi:beta-lactamase regulating signal transducer with metallopeptidase domain